MAFIIRLIWTLLDTKRANANTEPFLSGKMVIEIPEEEVWMHFGAYLPSVGHLCNYTHQFNDLSVQVVSGR